MGDHSFKEVNEKKCLGVTLQCKLNLSKQIQSICTKLNSTLGMLLRDTGKLSSAVKERCCTTLVWR